MKSEIKSLVRWGILSYGVLLSIVEVATFGSILVFKLIIDFLTHPEKFSDENSPYYLFGAFATFRMISILVRSYYDLHVYNYFKFV